MILGLFLRKASTTTTQAPFYGSVDGSFEKDRIVKNPGEGNTRDFTYFMLGNNRIIYASMVRLALIKVLLNQFHVFLLKQKYLHLSNKIVCGQHECFS